MPVTPQIDTLLVSIATRANELAQLAPGRSHEAERQLVAELAAVCAILRAGATDLGQSLAHVLGDASPAASPEPQPRQEIF